MAKPAGTGYSPLNWYDRLQLRAAAKHLHSRYASVRAAAHAEIKRILQKRRGLKTRARRGGQRLKERVAYGRLNRCNVAGCNHATRDKAMVQAHVRKHQREVIPKTARKQQPSGPARAPSQGRTLTETDLRGRAKSRKAASRTRPAVAEMRTAAAATVADTKAPSRTPYPENGNGWERLNWLDRERRAAEARASRPAPVPAPARAPQAARNGTAPSRTAAVAPVPPLPDQIVRAKAPRVRAAKARTTRIRRLRHPLGRSR